MKKKPSKVRKQAIETFEITIPLEYKTTVKMTTDFPNRRSLAQKRAVEELRRFLGDEIYFDDQMKRNRAHSTKIKGE